MKGAIGLTNGNWENAQDFLKVSLSYRRDDPTDEWPYS
jgi:uncharacterized protein HemY